MFYFDLHASQEHTVIVAAMISQHRSHLLLTVFSITALIELTEKWFQLRCPLLGSPNLVSSTDASEIRKLAKFVEEERQRSSKPLRPHVCSSCGQLLPAPTKEDQDDKAGAAFRTLGRPCDGYAMLPFFVALLESFALEALA